MKFGMRRASLVMLAIVLRRSAQAFTVPSVMTIRPSQQAQAQQQHPPASGQVFAATDVVPASKGQAPRPRGQLERALQGASFAAATGFAGASSVLAEYIDPDDVGEVVSSDLPPMWVPLAVGFVLTLGIGLLQGSLGDVMNDEAKLGALSGARAAKQSARDRDMFKKKGPK
ncbi:unnamed protein product [Ectocarpus sp. CCAP 1310/34]|nr:unnamed protein product [Ectocarpus sp. CCAP 1310/34]